MFNKTYSNFVKASSEERTKLLLDIQTISGEEARKIYLEEVKHAKPYSIKTTRVLETKRNIVRQEDEIPITNKDLFITVQNNDIETLKYILDKYPDKIHLVDDYGWSLLMIACQANSVDVAKLLLKRGVDISVRDKAGNSARSLVVKNKNYILADVLLSYKQKESPSHSKQKEIKDKADKEFMCDICNRSFPCREEHLSSTIHNISASRGKKIPAHYVLPMSNKGYQLMLKGGWDKRSGLGRDGSGKLYPIKTVQKKDRKGLGHEKQKPVEKSDDVKHKNKKKFERDHRSDRSFEINFRRQFY